MPVKGYRRALCLRGHALEGNRTKLGCCKTCAYIRHKAWVATHPEQNRIHQQKYADRHREEHMIQSRVYRQTAPEEIRYTRLKQRYKLSREVADQMRDAQGNCCAICAAIFGADCRPELDHCHATGRHRGWLCHACNVMLGQAKDSVDTLARAIVYLQK